MVAGEREPNLQPGLHDKLKQRGQKGLVEERERGMGRCRRRAGTICSGLLGRNGSSVLL